MAELRVSFKLITNQGLFEQHLAVNAPESWTTSENIVKELRPFIEGLVHNAAQNKESSNG